LIKRDQVGRGDKRGTTIKNKKKKGRSYAGGDLFALAGVSRNLGFKTEKRGTAQTGRLSWREKIKIESLPARSWKVCW